MDHKKIYVIGVILIAIAVILFTPVGVIAQNQCDQFIVDEAGVLTNKMGDVEAAVSRLTGSGADVRVRTIQTYGSTGNLDIYESQLEQQCPSWRDASGNRKNNLVVILVSIQDRSTGIFFGSQWDTALSGHFTQIQTQFMNPRFAQGDYAGGITAGLQEIDRLITGQPAETTSTPNKGASSALWVVLIFFLVLIFIVAVVVGIFLYRSYRKSREKRLAVRQKALLAKQGAASKVNQLVDEIQMLEIKVNVTAAKVSPEDAAPILESFNKAKNLVDQGAQKYSELGHSAGNPENPKLGETQLEVITQEYQKVLDTLNQANEEVTRVETSLATFQEAIDGFGEKAVSTGNVMEAIPRKMEAARNSGFKTDYPAGVLAQARQSLEQAKSLYQSKRYMQAMQNLGEANKLADQASQYTDELPQKKQETEAAIQALAARVERGKDSIIKGRNIFDRISNIYAESSWEAIQGNGTEAENRVEWTLDALEDARQAASPEQQDWQKSMELVKQGNAWMDEVESLMHSISAIEKDLEAARRDTPGEINAAQTDVIQAWKYINTYDEDIRESLEDDLREAEKKLNNANDEQHRNKPDYLMIVKLAREANDSTDKILIQARNEHEAAERMRGKIASALRDARSSVSIAREYIQDHSREAGDEARNLLSNAEAALRQSETTPDINIQLAQAELAENSANKAYSSARSRVSTAWERSRPTIPPVIIVPGGGSTWGSRRSSPSRPSGGSMPRPSGGGGGGSTRWGGGGGFRGGGGGGRGGGGSTRW